ncbi:MAG TPA: hypothetical protein ENK66_11420 [Arcobacter sp.]|nr:hypothetical protein [Arcobacter sp.]
MSLLSKKIISISILILILIFSSGCTTFPKGEANFQKLENSFIGSTILNETNTIYLGKDNISYIKDMNLKNGSLIQKGSWSLVRQSITSNSIFPIPIYSAHICYTREKFSINGKSTECKLASFIKKTYPNTTVKDLILAKNKLDITYIPIISSKNTDAINDLKNKEGFTIAFLMKNTFKAEGYVSDKKIQFIPIVTSQHSKKIKITFNTTIRIDTETSNSIFKYTEQGYSKNSYTRKKITSIIVDSYSKTKGEILDFGNLRSQEKVNTFITDIKINRKLSDMKYEILNIEFID